MDFPVKLPSKHAAIAQELGINPHDIDEHFIKGGGPGGQKINKTASAVHLIHRPSGIEVKIQKYRERTANRMSAWKLLILKIQEEKVGKESEIQQKQFKIRKQKQRRSKRAQEKILSDKHYRAVIKEGRRGADIE